MGVSDQLLIPTALLLGKEYPVPIEYVAGHAPKPVWTFGRGGGGGGGNLFATRNQTTVFPTLSPQPAAFSW